jgi:hypothetical protein
MSGDGAASVTLSAQLIALLDTSSKRELAARLVTVWRTTRERSLDVNSLHDLMPEGCRCQDVMPSCGPARVLVEVAQITASVAEIAGRESGSEGLRALCLELALRNSSGAARLQRQLLWESR